MSGFLTSLMFQVFNSEFLQHCSIELSDLPQSRKTIHLGLEIAHRMAAPPIRDQTESSKRSQNQGFSANC
jgi:hypothetical protein